jgi:predicted RNase H-like nuclease (RuvC/YqgF family)
MKLRDLEKLQSEIAILEARIVQLQEPTPATPLEGLPTAEILGEIQKTTERERSRVEELQNLQQALPILKERFAVMEKECATLKAELVRKMTAYEKAARKLNSSLDGALTQLEELRSLGLETQATYQQAYGLGSGRVPI